MYNYQTERKDVFTEQGQEMFLKIRDACKNHIKNAGCVRMGELMNAAGSGSSWTMMACVDRLVELKEIREISQPDCAGQHRIFVSARD